MADWAGPADGGVDLAVPIPPKPLPLTRARAYNDCVKDAVLLKTASNRGSGIPPIELFLS